MFLCCYLCRPCWSVSTCLPPGSALWGTAWKVNVCSPYFPVLPTFFLCLSFLTALLLLLFHHTTLPKGRPVLYDVLLLCRISELYFNSLLSCISALYFFLNGAILRGLYVWKLVFDVWVCRFCFIFVYGLNLSIWLEKGFTYLRVLKCAFAYVSINKQGIWLGLKRQNKDLNCLQ